MTLCFEGPSLNKNWFFLLFLVLDRAIFGRSINRTKLKSVFVAKQKTGSTCKVVRLQNHKVTETEVAGDHAKGVIRSSKNKRIALPIFMFCA